MACDPQTLAIDGAQQAINSPFLRACRLAPSEYTPIWLMRQAGRFLPEYREIRAKMGFLELCKSPETAAQVTVMAVEKLGVDAAIIFADILLVLEPMGIGLSFSEGDGPLIASPIRSANDIERLAPVDPQFHLSFVYEAICLARRGLKPDIPLIGFAGAPFTLASYLIEGGASKHFEKTKCFMYSEPQAWDRLMTLLSQVTVAHLREQIKAGAQTIQIFDSWVGCLSVDDYRSQVLPHVQAIISELKDTVPIIYFGTGSAALLPLIGQTGAQVIGLDWRVELAAEWSKIGYETAIQGNLDPCVLLCGRDEIIAKVDSILAAAQSRPGHIFNLGHGVLPQTPVDNVRFLVETVHELSSR
jgi:uroporphyrinogen decarboxylase